jgi:hypothetical protein
MADSKKAPKDKTGKSDISFPCGNFEKMLKKMRGANSGETANNTCSSIRKLFRKGKEGSVDCKTLMQKMGAANDGDIDFKAVMEELFGGISKEKSDKME